MVPDTVRHDHTSELPITWPTRSTVLLLYSIHGSERRHRRETMSRDSRWYVHIALGMGSDSEGVQI